MERGALWTLRGGHQGRGVCLVLVPEGLASGLDQGLLSALSCLQTPCHCPRGQRLLEKSACQALLGLLGTGFTCRKGGEVIAVMRRTHRKNKSRKGLNRVCERGRERASVRALSRTVLSSLCPSVRALPRVQAGSGPRGPWTVPDLLCPFVKGRQTGGSGVAGSHPAPPPSGEGPLQSDR